MHKINLKNCTLVAVGSTKISETLKAIEICNKFADFKSIKYFSSTNTDFTVHIPEITSIKDYDKFIVYELPKYIDTDYALTIHWDGFIVNPFAWTNKFLEYDYIGAPWPWINNFCGNGGFCLKSKKFLDTQMKLVQNLELNDPDDIFLSIRLRKDFIAAGCIYAPPEIGYRFSTEYGGYDNFNSFGFHDFRCSPQFKNLIYNNE